MSYLIKKRDFPDKLRYYNSLYTEYINKTEQYNASSVPLITCDHKNYSKIKKLGLIRYIDRKYIKYMLQYCDLEFMYDHLPLTLKYMKKSLKNPVLNLDIIKQYKYPKLLYLHQDHAEEMYDYVAQYMLNDNSYQVFTTKCKSKNEKWCKKDHKRYIPLIRNRIFYTFICLIKHFKVPKCLALCLLGFYRI